MPVGARTRAFEHLYAVVDHAPVTRWFNKIADTAPARARKPLARAVGWWHAEAIRRVPVRASRSKAQKRAGAKGPYWGRTGRGWLKKTTQPYLETRGDTLEGGIVMGADYAIWLLAGTRRIAGGAVLKWRPGQPTVKDWPAKRLNPSPDYAAELPIVLPWFRPAQDRLFDELMGMPLG